MKIEPQDGPPLEDGYAQGSDETDGPYADDSVEVSEDREWLDLSRSAFMASENWFDTSVRKRVEQSLARFNNRHPSGSKYHTDTFIKKSKVFRPKTRSAIRRMEAAVAVAFFSTQDMVHTSAVNPGNKDQVDAAEFHNSLLNYRLENSIPWFKVCQGGAQDALTTGVVISKQTWDYERRVQKYTEEYEDGSSETVEKERILNDKPKVDIIPLENLRISPSASWVDPINTSPYIIEMMPMYIIDVKRKMEMVNPGTGQTEFFPLEENLLKAAIQQDWDSVRKAREGDRIDKYENDGAIDDYQTVWVHLNIMRREDGDDWVWHTLGTEMMLSEPRPLDEYFLHGIRPYSMGWVVTETHKQYPAGYPELLAGLQDEINDTANLRLDNVKLAMNKRWVVRRGANVDVRALVRNVAGGVIMAGDPNSDVVSHEPRDVTGSSYQETDRLSLEADELSGTFSQSTVGSSRNLNETVGGMNMLSSDANEIKEYVVRTLSETWIEDVMRQLVKLQATYETDAVAIEVAASAANMEPLRAIKVMNEDLNVRVNVGYNATNPIRRIEKLSVGLSTIGQFQPELIQEMDGQEVVKEVFGALGYRDGARFFPNLGKSKEDPIVEQLKKQVQQLTQVIETKQIEQQGKERVAQIGAQGRLTAEQIKQDTQLYLAKFDGDRQGQLDAMKARLEQIDRMIDTEKLDVSKKELYLQREALSHQIQEADRRFQLEASKAAREITDRVSKPADGPMDLPGNDKAGVLARNNYDLIPQNVE